MNGYGESRVLISDDDEDDDGMMHATEDVGRTYPIFRVPSILRNNAPDMFTPRVVPIGPLHDPLFIINASSAAPTTAMGNPLPSSTYQESDALKELAVRAIFGRSPGAKQGFEAFLHAAKGSMISHSYGFAMEPEYVAHRFVPLLLSDSCFVAAVLNSLFHENLPGRFGADGGHPLLELAAAARTARRFHPSFSTTVSRPEKKAILEDIVMLVENQIPMPAIRRAVAIDCKCRSDDEAELLVELYVAALAHRILPFSKSKKNVFGGVRDAARGAAEHILDMMYSIVCNHTGGPRPRPPHDPHHDPHIRDMPGASRLYMSGVKLHGHWGGLDELAFRRGRLSLPKIHVGDDTEMYFRNLIAYESAFKTDRLDIISYLHFMDFLIDTPADVELLVENKIITETIGSDEKVAEMWNRLCRNTMCIFSHNYKAVADELKAYCRSPWRLLWAEFYRSNLAKPWLVISLLSGAALLVMTFFILWYTILLYRNDIQSRE